MPWSFIIPAAASLIGGALQSGAASDAASSQAQSSADAIGEQRRQFDLTRGDYAPYREVGVNALQNLASQIGQRTTAADVMQDPGYQFGLDQGQQAIDRKIAASGGRISGNAIKEAAKFGTDYATTGYTAADQRRETRLNRLAALANIGQTSTGASAQAGTAAANSISGIIQNQGDNAGRSALYQGGVWANAGNQIAAAYNRYPQQSTYQPSYQSGGGYGSVSGGYTDPYSGQQYNNPSAYNPSDARLKTNIRPIGKTARGNNLYSWDWKTGGSGIGVIAQEVRHIPGAVITDADGIMLVDYSKV